MSKGMGPIPEGFSAAGDGSLAIGGEAVEALVTEAGGTPLFAYDNNIVGAKIARFKAAMPAGLELHYAVKANPYRPLAEWMSQHVDGFDLASGGELAMVHSVRADCLATSFAGPGKSPQELKRAIETDTVVMLESEREAHRLIDAGAELGKRPMAMVRVNPPFVLKGAGMKMGGLASQFGVDHERVPDLVQGLIEADIDWRGLHVYAGSQCLDWQALAEMQRLTIDLVDSICREADVEPPEVNLGGGFGIPYFEGEQPLDIEALGAATDALLCNVPDRLANTRFSMELGRWLVGEAGVYLTRVVDVKESRGERIAVTDGGLHHFLAATGNFGQLLRRNYPVANATRFRDTPSEQVTVTGCLCTPLDLLADQVMLPPVEVGDIIAIFCAGAYGLSASPQSFLSQPTARELLV